MSESNEVVSVERVISAPPERIFEYLVDPAKHCEIDGSGTVQGVKGQCQRLELGSKFGMSMKLGVPYSMVSTVVELEPNRRIAWRTTGPTAVGAHVGGRVWRYELEPVEGGTLVRESWDISHESMTTKPLVRRGKDEARKSMAATLERIEQLVTSNP